MSDHPAYKFAATETFWKNFYALSPEQKASTRTAWEKFKEDPFHPSLRVHKIHALSAKAGCTVYSACIEADLRALFVVEGDIVKTLTIGTHAVYR